jgi:hypothetical protein
LAQLLSLFLAGAGHGWTTPFLVSVGLWVLLPAALFSVRLDPRSARLILLTLLLIGLGADFLLVRGTLAEWGILPVYLQVNGASGLLIILLWLAIWFGWQIMTLRALILGLRPPENADA